MRPSNHSERSESLIGDEAGPATLEFVVAGLLMLLPLVYRVLGAVQEQTLGAETAERHTARAIAQAPDLETAAARGDAVLAGVIREYGMDADAVDVGITCRPATVECPTAGSTVIVTVRADVSLPLMPSIFGLDDLAGIPIEAQAAQKVSRLWGSG